MAEDKEVPAEEVEVRRSEIMLPQVDGKTKAILYITYTVPGMTPGLVQIPKADWSEAKEADLIREDLRRRRESAPQKIRL